MAPETKVPTTVDPRDGQTAHANLSQNGHSKQNGFVPSTEVPMHRPTALPTFPMEAGWREVTDPNTGEHHRVPLTLLDILYPTEDDIGVVYMAQGPLHQLWSFVLAAMLRPLFDANTWLILQDVLIYWEPGTVRPSAPDVAMFYGGSFPEPEHQSYLVGRDGPVPTFVVEITSQTTRSNDLNSKPLEYAARGIREYLIIDLFTPSSRDWQLIGYRLEESSPFYQKLKPDTAGGLTFETVNLRFVAVKRSHIEVYNARTGERLLTLDEQKARAEVAEQQREAEAAARLEAEQQREAEAAAHLETQQKNQLLEAEVKRLRAQIKQQGADPAP